MRATTVLSVLAMACTLAPNHEPSGARAESNASSAAPASLPKRFDAASVRLPESCPEHAIRQALDAGNRDEARKLGEAALPTADAATRGRLLWLLAQAEAGEAAHARLADLSKSEHPLARWARVQWVDGLFLREPSRVPELLKGLTEGWAGAPRARASLALSYHAAGDFSEAETRLRSLVARAPADSAASIFVLPLAEILASRKSPEALAEALSLCRRVASRSPTTSAAKRADALALQVLARMRPKQRAALLAPSPDDELARGQALMAARRYQEAQAVFDKVAKRLKRDPERRCKAQLEAGRSLFYRKPERALAAERLRSVAKQCKDPDTRAWARYYAGSAYQRLGDPKSAIAQYDVLVNDLGEHSLADDVLLMKAVAQTDLGDRAAAQKTIVDALTRYPAGDMREEARFALAFDARAVGDHKAALMHLERLIAEGANERTEALEGRAGYWRARTLHALGQMDEAKLGYTAVAESAPLSYHAQQALSRLLELDKIAAAAVLAAWTEQKPLQTSLDFAWRSDLDKKEFSSAVELLRVGEFELARQELSWLGMLSDSAEEDLLWLATATLYEAGAYPEASQLARSRLRAFRLNAPLGRSRMLWRIAYPRAFEPLIEEAAREAQVPAEFVRAVAREESSFNPNVVSSALAYGLIQLIGPTARTYAKPLGLPSDPDALKRPEVNLRIGAHYIQALWQRYPSNPALVPAAYNAGEAAVDKWLRERGTLALDEWIERIPFRETRRYTRRVLQSYGIYSWLDTGTLPSLPSALPPAPTATH